MSEFLKAGDMEVEILSPGEAEQLDSILWQKLACESCFPNPFFEQWCLLPALRHFTDKQTVFLVVVRHDGAFVALFPVVLFRKYKCIPYVSIWQHDHCYLSDPLLIRDVDMLFLVQVLTGYFHAHWFFIPVHDPALFPASKYVTSLRWSRGAVYDKNEIEAHLRGVGGKSRREIRRSFKKLYDNLDIKYVEHHDLRRGLDNFCNLEHSGWKGHTGGSILSSSNVTLFYSDMIAKVKNHECLCFQELWDGNTLIASAMRMMRGGYWYDIKTTYNENYREYGPGKLLELINLEFLKFEDFIQLDSCTSRDNYVINKYWPHHISLCSSYIFQGLFTRLLWKYTLQLKWRLGSGLRSYADASGDAK